MARTRTNTRDKGGGSKKYGRDKVKCAAYRSRYIRERNKTRKLERHVDRFPNDECAKLALRTVKWSYEG